MTPEETMPRHDNAPHSPSSMSELVAKRRLAVATGDDKALAEFRQKVLQAIDENPDDVAAQAGALGLSVRQFERVRDGVKARRKGKTLPPVLALHRYAKLARGAERLVTRGRFEAMVEKALRATGGNATHTAEKLGISARQMFRLLREEPTLRRMRREFGGES